MTALDRGITPPPDDETLSAYLDGQLPPDARETVSRAVRADPNARQRLDELRATVALLHALPQPAPRRSFILTPEQAETIRPRRIVAPFVRFFPLFTAASAVAVALLLALFVGDIATGGFRTPSPSTSASRAAIEQVKSNATAAAAAAVAAPTTTAPVYPSAARSANAAQAAPAMAGAPPPAPAAAGTSGSAIAAAPAATTASAASVSTVVSGSAPAITGAAAATTVPATVAPTVAAPPVASTTVAGNSRTSDTAQPGTSYAPNGGAVAVTETTRRVPLALVRGGEASLALLAVVGLALAFVGWRARRAA